MGTKTSGDARPRRKRNPTQVLVDAALLVYAALIAAVWLSNVLGPDRWWIGAANLYLPQWLYAVPAPFALGIALASHRRRWYVPVILGLCVVGPLMGLRCRWFLPDSSGGSKHVRMMTWNVKWRRENLDRVVDEIRTQQPDLLVMQDASGSGGALASALGPEWNVRELDQYVFASRHPLTAPEPRWISYPEHNHRSARVEMDLEGRKVVVYTVHFMSPRYALLRVRAMDGEAAEGLEASADTRMKQAARLAQNIASETDPVLLGGDLNAPMQSVVCRTLGGAGLHDAFDEGGRGYGYTYGHNIRRIRHSYVRIDHIMASRQWSTQDCWAGTADVSDHRPVIADMVLEHD